MDQSLLETFQMASARWQHAGWYRAVTLPERLAVLRANSAGPGAWRGDYAERMLRQWKAQPPFQNESCFADRLAMDGMTERDLFQLLAEPGEALQMRMPPPDWLQELCRIFEEQAPPVDLLLPESASSNPTAAFLSSVQPLLARGRQRLLLGIDELTEQYSYLPFDAQIIFPSLVVPLARQLLAKVSKTYALELKVAGMLGHLQGKTPQERFQYFVERLGKREIILPLFEEYCVLARQLVLAVDQWVDFSLEWLRHLCADWEHICAVFSPETEPGPLVEVRAGAGDTHRRGRSVTTLKFRSGLRLVYKPRSLAIDLHFQELLCWLNARGSHPPFQTFAVIDQGSYGWSAFVEARECASEEEVQRFYERQGAYLALLYLFDAADLHAENIIAMGEHPMLIDLEALFHPPTEMDHSLFDKEPVFAALQHSVMRVGLLPRYIWGNEDARGVNISGLGGEEGQLSPRAVPRWKDAGTDQMRLVKARAEIVSSKNRPTFKGRPVDARDYLEHILAGFNKMYQTLLDHREALLAEMLPRFARDEIRFLARLTDIYARLLSDSFRPELLRDALERERHFDRLWVGIEWQPYMARLIPAERADLLRGDIPIFTTRPDCLDLFTSQREIIPGFLPQTSMNLVRQRLQQLDEQDRVRQLWLINASFLCVEMNSQRHFAQPHLPQPLRTQSTRSDWLTAACTLGDDLCRRAIHGEETAGWPGIFQVSEHEWDVQPARLDLYSGLPGIALFLAYLAKLTGEARYQALARASLRTIQSQLQHSQKRHLVKSIGAFDGWGGLIYLFTQLAVLWNEPGLLQEAEELIALVRDSIACDDSFDIMAGSAGCIAALLSLHAVTPSTRALEAALACGDHLLAHACPMQIGVGWKLRQQEKPLTGLAHGNAGIALSLLRLAEVSGAERFRQAALAALAHERSLFSPEQRNWPDLRKNMESTPFGEKDAQGTERFMVAWCHGAAGIGLARLASLPYSEESMIHAEIEHALATTIAASEKFGTDPTLCHGTAGLLETLLSARQVLARDEYTPYIERLAQWLLAFLETTTSQGEPQLALWWRDTPGFMTGLAGLGYTFLRLADPLRVPSVLILAGPEEAAVLPQKAERRRVRIEADGLLAELDPGGESDVHA